jgi:hypothetical protein
MLAALFIASAIGGCSTMIAAVVPPPPSNLYALPADSPARPFLGSYRFVGGDEERALVDKAIDVAVSSLDPFIRGFARSRLVAANGVTKKLDFLADTRWFEVRADGYRYVAHYDGTPYRVATSTGDVMDLHYKFGDTVEQTFEDEAKARVNTFELQDKRLIMHVRIRASVLPKDLIYDLTYERTDPAPVPAATASTAAVAPTVDTTPK